MSLSEHSVSRSGESVLQTHCFFSKCGFKPDGIQVITQQFSQGLTARDLPLEHKDELKYDIANNTFSLTVPAAVAADLVNFFMELQDKMVKEESARLDEDGFQVLNPDSNLVWLLEDKNVSGDRVFPLNFRSFPSKEIWISTVPHKDMSSVITEDVLKRISATTGAELIEDISRQQVFVASNEEIRTCVAIQKLENVVKFWIERQRIDVDVFYTENITDYQICFLLFPSIKKKLAETTLLDPNIIQDLDQDYHLLGRRMTLRCCPHQPRSGFAARQPLYTLKKGEKLRPVIDEANKLNPSEKWANFFYAGKGDKWEEPKPIETENDIQPKEEAKAEPRTMVDITSWTAGLPEPKTGTGPIEPPPMEDPVELYDKPSLEESLNICLGPIKSTRNDSPGAKVSSPPVPRPSLSSLGYPHGTQLELLPSSQNDDTLESSSVVPQNNLSLGTPTPMKLLTSPVRPSRLLSPTAALFHPQRENISVNHPEPTLSNDINRKSDEAMTTSFPIAAPIPLNPRSANILSFTAVYTSPPNNADNLSDILCQTSTPFVSDARLDNVIGGSLAVTRQSNSNPPIDSENVEISRGSLAELTGLFIPSTVTLMPGEDLDALFGGLQVNKSNATQTQNATVSRLQQLDELSDRKYHSTMSQQAPKKGKGHLKPNVQPKTPAKKVVPPPEVAPPLVPNPSVQCLARIQAGVEPILSQMRNWSGGLTLKAELGRIIIKNKIRKDSRELIYDEYKYNSFDPIRAEEVLAWNKIEFTNLVTTLPAEAKYLLDLKDGQNRAMWNHNPKSWQVRYIFSCRDTKSNTWFEVLMDGETHNYKAQSLPYTFGVVNVHATLRNWDYRIIAQGSESMSHEHSARIQEMVLSLSIPANRQDLEMTFEIADTHEIEVKGVRVRRECEHANLNGSHRDSVLHIDEVEDMCVLSTKTLAKGKTTYWVKSHDEETSGLKTFTRKWIEFSITSKCTDEAFKENLTLEIGESAEWEPENLVLEDLIPSLCDPMSQIVMKGDGLGFWNNDVRPDVEEVPVTNKQAISVSQSGGRDIFW